MELFFNQASQAFELYVPAEQGLMVGAAFAGALVLGIGFVLFGARLLTALAILGVAVGGAGVGAQLTQQLDAPSWIGGLIGGSVGVLLGYLLSQLLIALLLAAVTAGTALYVYAARVLTPHIDAFQNADGFELTALPDVGSHQGADLLAYLNDNVAYFQPSVASIALATGVAGFVLGLLMPRLGRALLAGTIGTVSVMAGVLGLLMVGNQTQLITGSPLAAAIGLGVLWVVAVFFNWLPGGRRKTPASLEETAPPTAPQAT